MIRGTSEQGESRTLNGTQPVTPRFLMMTLLAGTGCCGLCTRQTACNALQRYCFVLNFVGALMAGRWGYYSFKSLTAWSAESISSIAPREALWSAYWRAS